MWIFYCDRVYFDGIPSHAWTPYIVERVIGSKCSLQCINTDLVQPTDTRQIDLYAWIANPSQIPKRLWLVFTHRPSDKSTATFFITQELRHRSCWNASSKEFATRFSFTLASLRTTWQQPMTC